MPRICQTVPFVINMFLTAPLHIALDDSKVVRWFPFAAVVDPRRPVQLQCFLTTSEPSTSHDIP